MKKSFFDYLFSPTCLRLSTAYWLLAARCFLLATGCWLLATGSPPAFPQEESSCITCHEALEGKLSNPLKHIKQDIHFKRGFSCHDCHGGKPSSMDPQEAMNPVSGFVGKPAKQQVPVFCGTCHSNPSVIRKHNPSMRVDQVRLYFQSMHGKKLKEGDKNVAVCTDCHGVHGIAPLQDVQSPVYPTNVPKTCARCHANKKLMKKYGLPGTEYEEYLQSVHGEALLKNHDTSAPACNDCHGNHGALPPEVASIDYICGQCHVDNASLFEQTKKIKVFEEAGLPLCETCHENHLIKKTTDEMLGVEKDAVCVRCHVPGQKGYETARTLRSEIEKLKQAIEKATKILEVAERMGMDVVAARAQLTDARTQLVKARHVTHSFSVKKTKTETLQGLKVSGEIYMTGKKAVRESKTRRKGFLVYIIFSLFLGIGIYLKIKDMESRP